MVVNEAAARRNHVGRVTDSGENFSVYSQATLDAEDKAFVMKIQDTVRAAVEEARFAQVVGKMQEAKAAQMDTHDVPAVVKLASKEFHINDSESTGVLQRLIESNDLTLYGLSNAVTRHSQDVESYDRASELESIGYSIFDHAAPAVVENQPGSRLTLPLHTGGSFMSMMNANAAATTAMTTNEPLDFVLPEMGDADFSSEELAEDTDGLTMSFPRIKIPAGGVLQFEIPNGDPQHPDYRPTLTGVILYNHASCAYWPEGDEYNDDVPPLCSSVDGKQGYGEPGGTCATCTLSQFGSASNGRGKACKNMRVLYLLRSGEFMPLAINLSPTSISPFREFLNQGFVFRNRATYGSLVEIGLKRQTNPEGKDYSVATFKRLGDFHGDQLVAVRKYALSFREQIRGMNRQRIEAKT